MSIKDFKALSLKGFTLIELMIVLMIMAFAGAIMLPSLWSGFRKESVRAGGQKVIAYLRDVQRDAMRGGRPLTVKMNDKEGQMRYKDKEKMKLPGKLSLKSKISDIVFYPDGTATDAEISIISPDGRTLSVVVDPFSGLAKIKK